jgi:hypothetical protein
MEEINPKAYPLADEELNKQILDLVHPQNPKTPLYLKRIKEIKITPPHFHPPNP